MKTVQETESDVNESTDVEYLEFSLNFFQGEHQKFVKILKGIKKDLETLETDMKIIKSEKLKKACAHTYKSLMEDKRATLAQIREHTIDLKHMRSILKKIKTIEENE